MIDGALLSVPLLFSSTLSVGLAVITWRMSDLRTKRSFICLLIANAWLSATYLLELLSTNIQDMLFWNNMEYISNVFIPPLFLLFTLRFVGRDSAVNRKNMAILFVVPTLALVMLWTNDLHHLLFYHRSAARIVHGDLRAHLWPLVLHPHCLFLPDGCL